MKNNEQIKEELLNLITSINKLKNLGFQLSRTRDLKQDAENALMLVMTEDEMFDYKKKQRQM